MSCHLDLRCIAIWSVRPLVCALGTHATSAIARPVELDAAVTSIINVPTLLCGEDSIAPIITLKNNGELILTDAVLEFGVDVGAGYLLPWSGSLQSGQTVTVPLPAIPVVPGANELVVRVINPNGSVDAVPENDTRSFQFTANLPPAAINLILTLDDHGSDVTWELATLAGVLLYQGGPYADGNAGELDSVAYCLTNDCYVFTINDVFGDGLCCASGEGGYVIRDVFGTVYAESDGQYTDQHVDEFCLNGVSVPEDASAPLHIRPNPNNGSFLVVAEDGLGLTRVSITDACGRKVKELNAAHQHIMQVALDVAPGVYMVRWERPSGGGTVPFVVTR